MFLYLVNRRIPVDFRQFLIRHRDLFAQPASRGLFVCSCRGASGRPWRSTRRPLREELWTPLNPSVSKSLETYFRERQEQGGHLGDPSDRYIAQEFRKQGMPKIQALYRAWRRSGDKVLWQSSSTCLRDDWSYGRSAVEVQLLNRQYLQLTGSMDRDVWAKRGAKRKSRQVGPPVSTPSLDVSLTPGGSVSAHSVQAPVSQHLAADARSRRRSVPPSPSVSVSQSVNQRWRERPRCPASPVTPGRRDGVVHAIVGRVACRCLRAQVVQDERAARVHVFVSRFAGTKRLANRTEIGSCASQRVPGSDVTFCGSRSSCTHHRAYHAGAVLSVVNALRFASTRPAAGPSGIDDACARHDLGYCAMVGFLMTGGQNDVEKSELTRDFRRRILMYRVCAARHILRIATSACRARFQSSPSGHDSSAPPTTSRQAATPSRCA